MFCFKCGAPQDNDAMFCCNCGTRLQAPAAPVAPVVTAPVVEAPVVAAPVVEEPVVAAPVVEEPVVAAPVVEEPVVAAPVVEAPVVAAPVVEEPVVAASVVEEPVVAAPVVEAPVVAAPVVEAPVVAAPVVEAPVVAAPVVEAPVVAAPVVAASVQKPVQPVAQPKPAPQPVPPAYRPPVAPAAKHAPKTSGLKAIVWVTLLLSIALLAMSAFLAVNTDLFEIPMISMAVDAAGVGDEMDDAREELNKGLKSFKKGYDKYEDALPSKVNKAVENFIDSTEELTENFSILELYSFITSFNNLADNIQDIADEAEKVDVDISSLEDMEDTGNELAKIQNILLIVALGAFFLPLLFTLLGGFLKSTGLTITALIFTVFVQILLCPIWTVALSLVIYILQAVLCAKIKKAKRAAKFATFA